MKKYQKVKYSVFERAAEKLGLTPHKLSEELGYSPGSFNDWKKNGAIPKVAGIACEGLLRRARIKNTVVIKADNVEIISGDGNVKEIHPGIYIVEV